MADRCAAGVHRATGHGRCTPPLRLSRPSPITATPSSEAIDRIDPARAQAALQALRARLHSFRADEIDHRDDAAARFDRPWAPPSPLLRLWIWAADAGSRGAVKICRWI